MNEQIEKAKEMTDEQMMDEKVTDEQTPTAPYGLREIEAIAIMEGCFPEKFGVPRQAGIVKSARGMVRLLPPFNHENYLQGLELSSHIWLTFGFHQNKWNGRATVRPQRLGGNERMGVFATRSSFRPNGLGLSAVKIEAIHCQEGLIEVSGHDLVDGTPIYCIKPYIPFSDALLEATSDFAREKPEDFAVYFSDTAQQTLQALQVEAPYLEALITEVVGQNPTPQFHNDPTRVYGVSLKSWNILFKVCTDKAQNETDVEILGEVRGEVRGEKRDETLDKKRDDAFDEALLTRKAFLVTAINPR